MLNDPSQYAEQLDVLAADSSYIENYDKTNFLQFRTNKSVILDTNYNIITNK
jgi:hypothetical protein